MRTMTFATPEFLPTVETAEHEMRESRGEVFTIDVPRDADVSDGAGGDDPLLTVRWRDAVVRVIAHREVGVMTARDYGAEMFGVVRAFEPTGDRFVAEYGEFAGDSAPFMRGTAGDRALVATCAAPGVNRLIVIGSSPTGDEASAAEVETVIASIALMSA